MKIIKIWNLNPNYDKARKVIMPQGICDCLCAAMGMGGGYVPFILIDYGNSEDRKPERECKGP